MVETSSTGKDLFLLIKAVEYVENKERSERDREHGYAAPYQQYGAKVLTTKIKGMKRSHDRSTHNELEKNRRAHLRRCLEDLKAVVPLREDTARHTTLGLLTRASAFIKRLKEEEEVLFKEKSDEFRRNAVLKQTLMQLEKSRIRRNSTGSSWSSSHSESSTDSDKDDEIIDVIGCADEPNAAENGTSQRVSNFITINVPKSIMLQRKSFNFKVNRAKTNVVSY